MKNIQLFQEVASWQWEINGFQKAAFLIEERLDIIHKNASPTLKTNKISFLLNQIIDQEKELDEIESILFSHKETLKEANNKKHWPDDVAMKQQSIRNLVNTKKTIFSSIKDDYYKLLRDLLF